LHGLIEKCQPLRPLARAKTLENDTELESAYKTVATRGTSDVPADPEHEVDSHYVCFVKSNKDDHLYELDGDRKGPKDSGPLKPNDAVLSEDGRSAIKEYIQREDGQNYNLACWFWHRYDDEIILMQCNIGYVTTVWYQEHWHTYVVVQSCRKLHHNDSRKLFNDHF
jgi:hypothetical protein